MSNFVIDGVAIKNPKTFKIERYNITNMTRLLNGKMTGDIIAKKHKFYFTYDAITAADLGIILGVLWDTQKLFLPFDYVYEGENKSAVVYAGSLPAELHRANLSGNWVWKNFTFDLIEQ